MTLEIPGRPPSKKNSKRRIRRGHSIFMVPSEAHEAWHQQASYLIARHRPEKPLERCQVAITIYAPDRRRFDLTNAAESVMDLMVDCGFLLDDSVAVVPQLTLRFGGVDRERPRVVVVLT